MKMRKKIAALLAAAMIASVMPMSVFAASKNTLNKVVNVKEGDDLTTTSAVFLEVEMTGNSEFTKGEFFKIKLEDAEWFSTADMKAHLVDEDFDGETNEKLWFDVKGNPTTNPATRAVGAAAYSLYRESATTLVVTALSDLDGTISIPVVATITGSEPTISVDGGTSAVSSTQKLAFVNSTTGKALVSVDKVETIAKVGKVAGIVFEEPFVGAFKRVSASQPRTIEIELRDNEFLMDELDAGDIKLVPTNGFAQTFTAADIAAIRAGSNITDVVAGKTRVLKFELPDTVGKNGNTGKIRGGFRLEGLAVRPSRDARSGPIEAIISGNLVDREIVTLAKYGDYTTTLKMAREDYSVVAGKELNVKFTVTEDMANAIVAGRKATFEFSKGVIVNNVEVTKHTNAAQLNRKSEWDYVYKPEKDANGIVEYKKTNAFEVTDFKPNYLRTKGAVYEFEASLYVEAGFTGDITLTAEGKAFADKLETVVAKTEVPVTVEGKGTTLKVGLQGQETDASFVIKETAKHRLEQKDITIAIGKDYKEIKVVSADIAVTEGDLELDMDRTGPHGDGFRIAVKRFSSEPSTIEVKNIVFTTDRTIPEGKYGLTVSGSAISQLATKVKSEEDAVSAVSTRSQGISSEVGSIKDFITIGTKNTEDLKDENKKATVAFTVGSADFLINGETATMDAAAYIKDGRTMVPVRYVAQALGVNEEQVTWDGPSQTATIIAEKVIQVKLGSKAMLVNGANVPMEAAAELTNDRTFVPMGDIARALGVVVEWDNDTKTATFNPAK